jgi:hypothetical protein
MVPNPISDIGMFSPSLVLRYGREEEEEEEDSRDALVLPPLLRLPPRIDDGVVAGIERAAPRAGGDMRDALCAGCFRGFARKCEELTHGKFETKRALVLSFT